MNQGCYVSTFFYKMFVRVVIQNNKIRRASFRLLSVISNNLIDKLLINSEKLDKKLSLEALTMNK